MKRAFDIILSFISLILLLPIMIVVSILIFIKLGPPVLFVQVRPGKDEVPFKMLKFRSMTDARDAQGHLLPNADRLTPFGKFLRSSSLDELPALVNVLTGKMSLVGPRPLLMDYLPLYNDIQRRRHLVRPGITGLAQVKGRNSLSWEDKFSHDLWYVDNQNLWLDFKIIIMTLYKVLRREGITHKDDAAMPRFKGNNGQDIDKQV